MPHFENFGDVGQFIAGMAAAAFVIFWFLRNIRDVGGPKKDTGSIPVQDDATLRLLIMGAVVDLKAFIEEKAHQNRHDARNTLTVTGEKIVEKLDKTRDDIADDIRELKSKLERIEGYARRWRSNSRADQSEDS